jgi:hypothetical protein
MRKQSRLKASLSSCSRYLNALEAGVSYFSEVLNFKDVLRRSEQFQEILTGHNRKSNGKTTTGPPSWLLPPSESFRTMPL